MSKQLSRKALEMMWGFFGPESKVQMTLDCASVVNEIQIWLKGQSADKLSANTKQSAIKAGEAKD